MIRLLMEQDYENLKQLIYQVHELHYQHRPDIYVDGDTLPFCYFNEMINGKDSFSCVYEENHEICGLLMATKKTDCSMPITKQRTAYFIEDIVVDKHYRRKGIGKRLYFYLVEQAKKEQIDSIELNVWAFNEPAIKFYESIGMSVKNMRLEQLLKDNAIETSTMGLKITNRVHI